MSLVATPSQTVGPYFSIGLTPLYRADLAPAGVVGERIAIAGRVLDADGAPVNDALIEIWQADAQGCYRHPEDGRATADDGFTGFGRVATDPQGAFAFTTIRPGRVPAPDGRLQAPHLVAGVFLRGLLVRLATRIYFEGDPANADDPVLALVPAARRHTLMARGGDGVAALRWDVILQGSDETVFLDA